MLTFPRALNRLLKSVCAAAWLLVAFAAGIGRPPPLAATTADDLCDAASDPCVIDRAVSVDADSVIDVGARELQVADGGSLSAAGGAIALAARVLTVTPGGALRVVGSPPAGGGSLTAKADRMEIAGSIDASGSDGGDVALDTTYDLTISGTIKADGLGGDGQGGTITARASALSVEGTLSVVGGSENLGGEITLDSRGGMTVAGVLNASGGEGEGTITLTSGAAGGAGDLTVRAAAQIRADARSGGESGGSICLDARGDGVSTGHLYIDGVVSAVGTASSEGGGDGGIIELSAAGDIRELASERSTARLIAEGGSPDGTGGDIELSTTHGDVVLGAAMNARCTGALSGGGSVAIDASGDVTLGGSVTVSGGGGGGGDIAVDSTRGMVTVASTATIDATSSSGGSGGLVDLASGSNQTGATTSLVVDGRVIVDANGTGNGGDVELAGNAAVRVSGSLSAKGGATGGKGGGVSIAVDAGPARIEGPVSVSGSGGGGVLEIDAEGRISIAAPIDASTRGGSGGRIRLTATGPIDVSGSVSATNDNGAGGQVEIGAQDDVTVAGTVTAGGDMPQGGRIVIEGCLIVICGLDSRLCPSGSTGRLSSSGPSGKNRLVGRGRAPGADRDPIGIAVFGTLRADAMSGRNELVYDGNPDRRPAIFGLVEPTEQLIVDRTLQPCPVCGNGLIESPETCEDGNVADGDGCSATCQLEAVVPGDANGDRRVTNADIENASGGPGALIKEIFDGDGDTVGMVSSPIGRFPGNPGADANQDHFITAADIPATILVRESAH